MQPTRALGRVALGVLLAESWLVSAVPLLEAASARSGRNAT